MIPVSAELAAAITAPERTVRVTGSVDWDGDGHGTVGSLDDISGHIESVTVSRSTTRTLPDDVQVVEGVSAATGTVDLVGGQVDDEALSTVRYWSRFNTASPLHGKRRAARDVQLAVEFLTTTGWQPIDLMAGAQLDSIPVSASAQTASMELIDTRDRLRTRVTLPAMLADTPEGNLAGISGTNDIGKPGLEASWIISFALWKAGYSLSPPPGNGCVLWVPMHGSAQPMLQRTASGTCGLTSFANNGGVWSTERVTFDTGPFFLATSASSSMSGPMQLAAGDPMWDAYGRSAGRVEVWVCPSPGGVYQPFLVTFRPDSLPSGVMVGEDHGAIRTRVWLDADGTTGIEFENGPYEDVTVAGPTVTFDGVWHRFGCHWDDAAGRVVFVWDDTETVETFTGTTGSAWTGLDPDLTFADLVAWQPVAELHISTGLAEADDWLPLTWNPAAEVDRLQNRTLDGIWPADPIEAWELISAVTGAEFGLTWVSADGMPRVWSRARLASAVGQAVQRTVTSKNDIIDLSYDDRASQLRNIISVKYTPLTMTGTSRVTLWELDEIEGMPPGGTWTSDVEVTLPVVGPMYLNGVLMIGGPTAPTTPGSTYVLSNSYMTLGVVDVDIDILSQTPSDDDTRTLVRVTVTNTSSTWLWFADYGPAPSFVPLQPALTLDGATIKKGVTQTREVRHEQSISDYGERPLSVEENQWHQNASMAEGVAQGLSAALSGEQYVITDLQIIGDPRLELWDRVSVQDLDATMLETDIVLDGITTTVNPGCDQSLVARPAYDLWVVGGVGVGTPLGTTIIGSGA